jgi:hypothetical protein
MIVPIMSSIELPSIPRPPFEPIPTRNCVIGGRVLHHVLQNLSINDPAFKALCDHCDQLREQIRTTVELPLERAPTFCEYVTTAKKLTAGLDLSNRGIGVCIAYNKTTLNDRDFDICCLGFNVGVGLLRGLSRVSVGSEKCIPEVTGLVKYARAVCDRVLELYRDDFRAVLTREMVQNLSGYVNAAFGYALVLLAFFKQEYGKVAKLAVSTARLYAGLAPPQTGIATFLTVFADAEYCRALGQDPETIGEAISYGRNAIERLKGLPAKFDKGDLAIIRKLVDGLKPELEQLEGRNRIIYFKSIPKYSEVPAAQLPPLKPADVWAVGGEVMSVEELVKQRADGVIMARITAVAAAADPLLAAADKKLAEVPKAEIQELAQLVSTLFSQRTLARQLGEEVERVLRTNPSGVSKSPEIGTQAQELRRVMDQGAATDLHFETNYAKAKSTMDEVEKVAARIVAAREALTAARGKFDSARRGSAGVADLDAAQNQADSAIAELNVALCEIDTELATKRQDFLATAEQLRTGFTRGIAFYEKVAARYEKIRSILGGLK